MDRDWIFSGITIMSFTRRLKNTCRCAGLKTGSLSRLAAQIGFAVGGTDPNTCLMLGELFEDVGVAFQIIDDVTNLTTGNPGKNRGDDIVEGKKSLPVIFHAMADPDSIPELAKIF